MIAAKRVPDLHLTSQSTLRLTASIATKVLSVSSLFSARDVKLDLPAELRDDRRRDDARRAFSEHARFAVGGREDRVGFPNAPREDSGWPVAGKHKLKGLFCARPLAAGTQDRKAGADSSHRPVGLTRKNNE